MKDIDKLVRDNIRSLIPYSSARDDYSGNGEVFLDANENPYGELNRYPDPYQRKLKEALSRSKDIPAANIFLGNGSDEAIDLLFRIFCNPGKDKALTFTPTYGMYQVSASINDVEMLSLPLNKEFQIDIKKAESRIRNNNVKLIFICSPNNPSGNSMNHADVEYIITNAEGIVVIDEAYIDFSKKPSFTRHIDKFNNLVVMQTLSKAWGMASVRAGMVFADSTIISYLNKVKPPYNMSTINQETVLKRLSDKQRFTKELNSILEEKKVLEDELRKIELVEYIYPSDANFLLVKVRDADAIYDALVKKDIIVRNRSKVVNNCLRITVGTKSENSRLINALRRLEI
jgi:histidinol-phosphate aminotransferase